MVSHAHEASGLSGSIPHEASSLQLMFTAVTELGARLVGQRENGWAVIRGQMAGWMVGQQNKVGNRKLKTHTRFPRELSTKLPPTNQQTVKLTESCEEDQAFILQLIWWADVDQVDQLMWTRWSDDTGRAGVWWLGTWGEPGSAKKTTQWGRSRTQKAFNKRRVSCPKAEAHSKKCSTYIQIQS